MGGYIEKGDSGYLKRKMGGYLERKMGRYLKRKMGGYLERKMGGYLERKMGGYRFCKIVHEDSAQVCLFSLLEGGWGAYMDLRNGKGGSPPLSLEGGGAG